MLEPSDKTIRPEYLDLSYFLSSRLFPFLPTPCQGLFTTGKRIKRTDRRKRRL